MSNKRIRDYLDADDLVTPVNNEPQRISSIFMFLFSLSYSSFLPFHSEAMSFYLIFFTVELFLSPCIVFGCVAHIECLNSRATKLPAVYTTHMAKEKNKVPGSQLSMVTSSYDHSRIFFVRLFCFLFWQSGVMACAHMLSLYLFKCTKNCFFYCKITVRYVLFSIILFRYAVIHIRQNYLR